MQTDEEPIVTALADFLRTHVEDGTQLRAATAINRDLGIHGADAHALLDMLETQFGFATASLPFDDFFLTDAESIQSDLLSVSHALFGESGRLRPLTIEDLVRAVLRGAWPPLFDPANEAEIANNEDQASFDDDLGVRA